VIDVLRKRNYNNQKLIHCTIIKLVFYQYEKLRNNKVFYDFSIVLLKINGLIFK